MSNRTPTRSIKVPAEDTGLIGALYVHVEHDLEGRFLALRISSPGRTGNTQMETVLQAIGEKATELMQEILRDAGRVG